MLVVSKHVYHSNLHKITPKNNESTDFYSTQEYVSAKKSQHLPPENTKIFLKFTRLQKVQKLQKEFRKTTMCLALYEVCLFSSYPRGHSRDKSLPPCHHISDRHSPWIRAATHEVVMRHFEQLCKTLSPVSMQEFSECVHVSSHIITQVQAS